jgi:hypothetical protein
VTAQKSQQPVTESAQENKINTKTKDREISDYFGYENKDAFWDIAVRAMIALMMVAGLTSETSVYFYETTRRYIPEEQESTYMNIT